MNIRYNEDVDAPDVYDAESKVELPEHYQFSSFDECKDFTEAVTTSQYWFERGGEAAMIEPILLYRQRCNATSAAGYEARGLSVRLNERHYNVLIICHELAHIMAKFKHSVSQGHGKLFRTEYLSLVKYVSSSLASDLAEKFNEADLDWEVDTKAWDAPKFVYDFNKRINGAIAL